VSPAEQADATTATAPALEVRGVSVRFGGVAALTGVSLQVPRGTVTGLIGPNGAGKTTLFNVISGLQRPDHGNVYLRGVEVTRLKPHRRARLGMSRTFQRLELFGSLSAEENVLVGVEAPSRATGAGGDGSADPGSRRTGAGQAGAGGTGAGGAGADPIVSAAATATACALLQRVGAGDTVGELVNSLPTGSARLVELARALSTDPQLLLLDEPCSGLDEAESSALGHLLRDLASEGRSVLLVEHDMPLVLEVCDLVHVLDFGEVIASGTPDSIKHNALVQAAYLGQMDAPAGTGDVP
jgi:branched-chain amino acid transport system ATP-binding protein